MGRVRACLVGAAKTSPTEAPQFGSSLAPVFGEIRNALARYSNLKCSSFQYKSVKAMVRAGEGQEWASKVEIAGISRPLSCVGDSAMSAVIFHKYIVKREEIVVALAADGCRRRVSRVVIHLFVVVVLVGVAIIVVLVLHTLRLLLLLLAALLVAAEAGDEAWNGDRQADENGEENILLHPRKHRLEVCQTEANISLERVVANIGAPARILNDDVEFGVEKIQILGRAPEVVASEISRKRSIFRNLIVGSVRLDDNLHVLVVGGASIANRYGRAGLGLGGVDGGDTRPGVIVRLELAQIEVGIGGTSDTTAKTGCGDFVSALGARVPDAIDVDAWLIDGRASHAVTFRTRRSRHGDDVGEGGDLVQSAVEAARIGGKRLARALELVISILGLGLRRIGWEGKDAGGVCVDVRASRANQSSGRFRHAGAVSSAIRRAFRRYR